MNATTLQILEVIRQYLITVSVYAIMQYSGTSKQVTRAASQEAYDTKTTADPSKDYSKYTSAAFIQSLEDMINWIYSNNIDRLPEITVELIGVFVWIGGVTVDNREVQALLRKAGFQGSYKKQDDGSRKFMWKWTYEIRRFNAEDNIDNIRRRYGSENYKRSGSGRKQLA